MNTINDRVKELRKYLNLTLERFAEPLGVKKNAISRIETLKSNVTEQMLLSICRVNWNGKYVNEDWLRTGEGAMFLEAPEEDEYFKAATKLSNDPVAAAIILEYFKWDDNTKEAFKNSLKNIVKMIEEHEK